MKKSFVLGLMALAAVGIVLTTGCASTDTASTPAPAPAPAPVQDHDPKAMQ